MGAGPSQDGADMGARYMRYCSYLQKCAFLCKVYVIGPVKIQRNFIEGERVLCTEEKKSVEMSSLALAPAARVPFA